MDKLNRSYLFTLLLSVILVGIIMLNAWSFVSGPVNHDKSLQRNNLNKTAVLYSISSPVYVHRSAYDTVMNVAKGTDKKGTEIYFFFNDSHLLITSLNAADFDFDTAIKKASEAATLDNATATVGYFHAKPVYVVSDKTTEIVLSMVDFSVLINVRME